MSQINAVLHHGRKVWRSGNADPLRRAIAWLAAGRGVAALGVAYWSASPALSEGIAAFGLKRLPARSHEDAATGALMAGFVLMLAMAQMAK